MGVLISDLYPGGPAQRAGLQPGDVVTEINGREVADPKALRYRIATLEVGQSAPLTVIRKGVVLRLTLSLEAPPEDPPRRLTLLKGQLGISRRSPARRFGMRPGDMLVAINDRKIESVADARFALRGSGSGWRISVLRDGRVLTVSIDG